MARGNCYTTCEALYHLLGGKEAGYKPMTLWHEGKVHWFLLHISGLALYEPKRTIIIDPTASQFKTPPDYRHGRGRGFLTKHPSKRARLLMQQLVWQT